MINFVLEVSFTGNICLLFCFPIFIYFKNMYVAGFTLLGVPFHLNLNCVNESVMWFFFQIFAAPSFDDKILEVVAIFDSVQMAVSRVIKLQHHRIAQVGFPAQT